MKSFFLFCLLICGRLLIAQPLPGDTLPGTGDSSNRYAQTVSGQAGTRPSDTVAVHPPVTDSMDYRSVIDRALSRHPLLNARLEPVSMISQIMTDRFDHALFYAVLGVIMLLALLRFFYDRYFSNLFRVFFNTSLRQSQLTDQLLQARQVSLFFNLLFVATGGVYLCVVLKYYGLLHAGNTLVQMGSCALALAIIYFSKMLALRFTGWLTGFESAAGTYLFIIFLINKMLGILLLPFVVLIAFGQPVLQYPALLISLMMVALLFMLRFLRSYGLLRREIKVSRFHFFVYMAGVEILPLLLIYKATMLYFEKNG